MIIENLLKYKQNAVIENMKAESAAYLQSQGEINGKKLKSLENRGIWQTKRNFTLVKH